MSLFTDLRDVLTPYAKRINGLKADLGVLASLDGDSLISVTDLQASTGTNIATDAENGEITVSTTSAGTYRCAQTSASFIQSKLTVGKSYRIHVRADKISGNPIIRLVIRGVSGNADGVAKAVVLGDGGEGFFDFTVNAYMRKVTLFATWNTSSSASVKFSDLWIKENIQTQVDDTTTQLDLMNSVNLYRKPMTSTENGITLTTSGDGYVTLTGQYTEDKYFDIAELSDLNLTGGKDYYLNFTSISVSNAFLAIYYNTGSGLQRAYTNLIGINKIHVPEGVTAMILRLYARANVDYANTYKLTLSEAKSNADLDSVSASIRFLQAFGTGDCTIIKFSDGTSLVIDFGINEEQGTLQRNWQRAIDALGITHIDYAIISHYHGDHLGMLFYGTGDLIDSNTTFFTASPYTEADLEGLAWMDSMANNAVVRDYTRITNILTELGVKRIYPTEGQTFLIGGAEVRFWNCDHREYLDAYINHEMYDYNECSLCNYITIGTQRICFSGDIGTRAMNKYKASVLPSQIFKVNHHSIGYAVVPLFLNSLMPDLDITMQGHNLAVNNLASNPNQQWCENNHVPNVVTGINEHNIPLYVDEGGYKFLTSCRRLICADEGMV